LLLIYPLLVVAPLAVILSILSVAIPGATRVTLLLAYWLRNAFL